ncbi:hypothetical protein CY34DRAFT_543853 [Suillus luteus UH-Slu-Lm8-n1]|uniref:Unplaced genomic scaffold CY34scaffold_431, whole genome shotgun sequence n=1 Tax=Suillus luteus UH-Slu-Lm8-n1 TaxID=930992 RepID=A0A0D0AW35_9AGAM|nr:hypothetical protein CY34DRAFT_543853 [Suillus luteus UH-Slu-Lm8-n1]
MSHKCSCACTRPSSESTSFFPLSVAKLDPSNFTKSSRLKLDGTIPNHNLGTI